MCALARLFVLHEYMSTDMVLLFLLPPAPPCGSVKTPFPPRMGMCIPPLFARGMRYVLFVSVTVASVACSAFVLFY